MTGSVVNCCFCLLLLFGYSTCTPKQFPEQAIESPKEALWQGNQDGILFMHLMVLGKESFIPASINLLDAKIRDGKVKTPSPTNSESGSYEIVTQVLDCDKQLKRQHTYSNPLVKNIEFVNEVEQLERRLQESEAEELFIRMQLRVKDCFLRIGIQEIGTNNFSILQEIDLQRVTYIQNG